VRHQALRRWSSVLITPQHLAHYEKPDAAALAAAYGCGIACNYPFVDGNNRTALVAVELFLMLNGFELSVSDEAQTAFDRSRPVLRRRAA
jgi:death on curing protein